MIDILRAAERVHPEAREMDEVLTVDEVAGYLRVHPMTVQRWCRTGDLPAAKIGRAYRIKRRDLEEFWTRRTAHEEARDRKIGNPPETAG